MKVKFSDWKYVESGSFYNDEEEIFEISVNEGMWCFSVDGKEYYWCVREEYYYDEDGDSKGSSLWVRDMNDNRKVLCDNRWINWGVKGVSNLGIDDVNMKFNDEMSVSDFVIRICEELEENDIYIFNNEDMDYEKDKLIELELNI